MTRILITGGAGFIGSHLADALLAQGHEVIALDNLDGQVHAGPPAYLDPRVDLRVGDLRDLALVRSVLRDVEVVFHFAAMTGTSQSMYAIGEYSAANVQGTANLLQAIVDGQRVAKLINASSRAVYGEGAYRDSQGRQVFPPTRSAEQLRRGEWAVVSQESGEPLTPIATPESKVPDPGSIYAVQKLAQEQMGRLVGDAYGVPVVNLRFFNVYGPRQSLQNPYMGVIGFFATQLVNNRPVRVYEDGGPTRDFVHVDDVVRACLLAMTSPAADGQTINIGSGRALSLLQMAEIMSGFFDAEPPVVTGQYRVGDVRHCYADLDRARALLGYAPLVTFEDGIAALLGDLRRRGARWADRSAEAAEALRRRRLGS